MLALLLLSSYSYWLMRLFHSVVLPVNLTLLFSTLIVVPITLLKAHLCSRQVLLWFIILGIALINLGVGLIYQVELTTQARFQQTQYYLVRFNHLQTYTYNLYRCDLSGILCHRSSGYLGIPYQQDPITLKYDHSLDRVYIQNRRERIEIPD